MRAQIATEYLFIMMFATLLLVVYLTTASIAGTRAMDTSVSLTAQRIAFDIQSEIIIASQVRDGYSRTFWIPPEEYGRTVLVGNGTQVVTVRYEDVSTLLRTPPYTGPISTGWNTIRRVNGTVIFG